MRLLLAWFGYELDISFGPTTVDEDTDERGDCTTYPIGFNIPRVPWEDPGSLHQFDPDSSDEDA